MNKNAEQEKDDLNTVILEQEIAQNDFNLDVQNSDFEHNKKIQKLDLFSSRQEIIRRDIEALISILKLDKGNSIAIKSSVKFLELETSVAVEKKLISFIEALQVPES